MPVASLLIFVSQVLLLVFGNVYLTFIISMVLAGLASGLAYVGCTMICIEDYGGSTKTFLRPLAIVLSFGVLGTLIFE
jgi:hypothetical protein